MSVTLGWAYLFVAAAEAALLFSGPFAVPAGRAAPSDLVYGLLLALHLGAGLALLLRGDHRRIGGRHSGLEARGRRASLLLRLPELLLALSLPLFLFSWSMPSTPTWTTCSASSPAGGWCAWRWTPAGSACTRRPPRTAAAAGPRRLPAPPPAAGAGLPRGSPRPAAGGSAVPGPLGTPPGGALRAAAGGLLPLLPLPGGPARSGLGGAGAAPAGAGERPLAARPALRDLLRGAAGDAVQLLARHLQPDLPAGGLPVLLRGLPAVPGAHPVAGPPLAAGLLPHLAPGLGVL